MNSRKKWVPTTTLTDPLRKRNTPGEKIRWHCSVASANEMHRSPRSISHTQATGRKWARTVIRSSQVPVKTCAHYPSERSWKSCELGVLAMKELRPMEVQGLAPLSQRSTGQSQSSVMWKPHRRQEPVNWKPNPPLYLFLFYSSS